MATYKRRRQKGVMSGFQLRTYKGWGWQSPLAPHLEAALMDGMSFEKNCKRTEILLPLRVYSQPKVVFCEQSIFFHTYFNSGETPRLLL